VDSRLLYSRYTFVPVLNEGVLLEERLARAHERTHAREYTISGICNFSVCVVCGLFLWCKAMWELLYYTALEVDDRVLCRCLRLVYMYCCIFYGV